MTEMSHVLYLVNQFMSLNPFATDGTQNYRFEKFFNFHLEGKGCPDTYERRDYEALAG